MCFSQRSPIRKLPGQLLPTCKTFPRGKLKISHELPIMAEVDDYLQREYQQGCFHSKGQFSIDLAEALPKLGRFGRQHPCGFVLSLVQAGCLLGARSMTIQDFGTHLLMSLELPAGVVDLESAMHDLESHLLKPCGSERWEPFYCRAVVGALGVGGQQLWMAHWEGDEPRQLLGMPRDAEECQLRVHRQIQADHKLTWELEKPRSLALDAEYLGSRLRFCPFPVVLVRHSLGPFILQGDLRLRGWVVPSASGVYSTRPFQDQVLADLYLSGADLASRGMLLRPLCDQSAGNRIESRARIGVEDSLPWMKSCFPELVEVPFRSHLRSGLSPLPGLKLEGQVGSGKSAHHLDLECEGGSLQAAFMAGVGGDRLIPVVWGVSLQPLESIWACSGLEVVASLPELPTDLTGERLLEGEELQNWVREKRAELADFLDRPLSELDRMAAGVVLPERLPVGAAAACAALALVCGKFFLLPIAVVGGYVSGSATRAVAGFVRPKHVNQPLRQVFESSLREMQDKLRRGKAHLRPNSGE